jgi:hypothetical protein
MIEKQRKIMKLKLVAISLAVALLSAGAHAKGPNWDYLEASVVQEKDKHDLSLFNGTTIKGYSVELSKELSHEFFVNVKATQMEDELITEGETFDFRNRALSFGIGYNHRITYVTDVYAMVSFEGREFKLDSSTVSTEATGLSYGLGFRSLPAEWIELYSEVKRIDIEKDKSTSLALGARINISNAFSFGGEFKVSEYNTESSFNLRYSF